MDALTWRLCVFTLMQYARWKKMSSPSISRGGIMSKNCQSYCKGLVIKELE